MGMQGCPPQFWGRFYWGLWWNRVNPPMSMGSCKCPPPPLPCPTLNGPLMRKEQSWPLWQLQKYTQVDNHKCGNLQKQSGQDELYNRHKDARVAKHTSKQCFRQVHRPEPAHTKVFVKTDDISSRPPPPPPGCTPPPEGTIMIPHVAGPPIPKNDSWPWAIDMGAGGGGSFSALNTRAPASRIWDATTVKPPSSFASSLLRT